MTPVSVGSEGSCPPQPGREPEPTWDCSGLIYCARARWDPSGLGFGVCLPLAPRPSPALMLLFAAVSPGAPCQPAVSRSDLSPGRLEEDGAEAHAAWRLLLNWLTQPCRVCLSSRGQGRGTPREAFPVGPSPARFLHLSVKPSVGREPGAQRPGPNQREGGTVCVGGSHAGAGTSQHGTWAGTGQDPRWVLLSCARHS